MNFPVKKPKIILICGPTGIGKTSFATKIAKEFCSEIISADSMQIYKYMNIGTAKPTIFEQSLVPHHMIDIVYPDGHFDAAMFARMASDKIIDLDKHSITPFVVGGTGLYIKALLHGLSRARPADPFVLERLKKEAFEHEPGFLHKRLNECDPRAANKIHPNDTFRIVRALEIFESTGKTISACHQEHKFKKELFDVLQIGLDINRELLYERINRRVDIMIESGMVDEVKELLDMGYSESLKSMQSIGYRHIVDFIKKRFPWNEILQIFKRDTRRYAKRQLTWFKADPNIKWIDPEQSTNISGLVKKFISSK